MTTIKPRIAHTRRAARCIAATSAVGLLLGVAACSSSDEQETAHSASAEMQPEIFTFAPPDGTKGVRTDHHTLRGVARRGSSPDLSTSASCAGTSRRSTPATSTSSARSLRTS